MWEVLCILHFWFRVTGNFSLDQTGHCKKTRISNQATMAIYYSNQQNNGFSCTLLSTCSSMNFWMEKWRDTLLVPLATYWEPPYNITSRLKPWGVWWRCTYPKNSKARIVAILLTSTILLVFGDVTTGWSDESHQLGPWTQCGRSHSSVSDKSHESTSTSHKSNRVRVNQPHDVHEYRTSHPPVYTLPK